MTIPIVVSVEPDGGINPSSDIVVLEENKPREVRGMQKGSEVSVRIGLLIDTSGSSRRTEFLNTSLNQSLQLLSAILQPMKDAAFIAAFNDQIVVSTEYTGDVSRLIAATRGLKAIGGSALYDAVYHSSAKVHSTAGESPRLDILILIADGGDNASFNKLDDAIALAQRNNVAVYAISTVGRSDIPDANEAVLKRLSEATGGRLFLPRSTSDVEEAFRQIRQDLARSYLVTFSTNERTGRSRRVRIESVSKQFQVRVQERYFPPVSSPAR